MKMLIILIGIMLGLTVLVRCAGDWWESNRCELLDRNHTFTKATVIYGNTNVVYDVVAWRDYSEGDEVQLWVKDEASQRGHKVVLTHYSRVIWRIRRLNTIQNSNIKE